MVALLSQKVEARVLESDWAGRLDYEKLVSCGLLQTPFYGQRVWLEQRLAAEIEKIDILSNTIKLVYVPK